MRGRRIFLSLQDQIEIQSLADSIAAELSRVYPCSLCGAGLPSGRRYLCEFCQASPPARSPVPRLDGCLHIPFDSDPRYHWWADGQSALTTARELGDTTDRYDVFRHGKQETK